ncbi:MAG TPA: SAM-dependent methyltransferase [Lacibacter sp.]|nr:SAM-dependent methyltransferase [Lacibacter sp.]HMO88849.1 SAM-dependent methyltransferase [Lacibacter sp.]
MPAVYLIPAPLHEATLPGNADELLAAVRRCQVLFAENERSARRYLKQLDRGIVIDDFEWHTIHKAETVVQQQLRAALRAGKTVGILSEAGCPGVADPGQLLVGVAHAEGAVVKPLVGPSSLLLALMASGFNGQQFCFHGYLPIEAGQRRQKLRELEEQSARTGTTQLFIETPYRNHALLESILASCRPTTLLCVAADLTAPTEWIRSLPLSKWKGLEVELHKRPAIFLMYAGK